MTTTTTSLFLGWIHMQRNSIFSARMYNIFALTLKRNVFLTRPMRNNNQGGKVCAPSCSSSEKEKVFQCFVSFPPFSAFFSFSFFVCMFMINSNSTIAVFRWEGYKPHIKWLIAGRRGFKRSTNWCCQWWQVKRSGRRLTLLTFVHPQSVWPPDFTSVSSDAVALYIFIHMYIIINKKNNKDTFYLLAPLSTLMDTQKSNQIKAAHSKEI